MYTIGQTPAWSTFYTKAGFIHERLDAHCYGCCRALGYQRRSTYVDYSIGDIK